MHGVATFSTKGVTRRHKFLSNCGPIFGAWREMPIPTMTSALTWYLATKCSSTCRIWKPLSLR